MTRAPGVIRAELDSIAPLETADTAGRLARHFAVRAQERWTRQLGIDERLDSQQITLIVTEFAAALALTALATHLPPDIADAIAAQIRDSLDDGGSVGEWLYEHLGDEAVDRISTLASELVAAVEKAAP